MSPTRPAAASGLPAATDARGRTLGAEELAALERVIASGMLSAVWGTEVKALEAEMAGRFGLPHAVACSSGTAALHLAVAAADLSPADEVITTPISDFGTVAPILAQNAVPVFADVDAATGNLDPVAVRKAITARTKAIVAVHLFGAPAPIAELRAIADDHGLTLIEDCAQAWLTEVDDSGRLAGTVGHIGCFSLQQWKHITCGDGGLVITSDAARARRMRLFADKGWPRDENDRVHLFLGLNYRMTELQGAVARAQLAKVDEVVHRRRERAGQLAERLPALPGLHLPDPTGHAWWMFPLIVDPERVDAAAFAAGLQAAGVPATAGYLDRPLYANPALRTAPVFGESRYPLAGVPDRPDITYPEGTAPTAEQLITRTLVVLAWNERYTVQDVDDIASAIVSAYRAVASDSSDPAS
jgi:perosamine synthetase